MIFNIIEEAGSKSNSKRKFLSFPGLPQAHGASSFARASPGNTHPPKRGKKKKRTRFQAGETKKNGVQTLFLSGFLLGLDQSLA
jgi:hypothetical protein